MTATTPASRHPISAVWRWSLRRSPILVAFRALGERFRRHAAAAVLIQNSTLSAPVRERLTKIVRRTRLHASEQADIARELIAHARDAADAGNAEPETLAGLGDPRPVARLIRRAVKRKRPLPYQIRRWAARSALGAFVLAVLFYAALTARFYAGAPSIKTDYFARLNAPVHALPEPDKAWPVYLDALIEWDPIRQRLTEISRVDPYDDDVTRRSPGVDSIYDVPRDHPDYDATVAALKSFRPTLDRVAQAADRPALGVLYSDRTRAIEVDGADHAMEVPIEPAADPGEQGSLLSILLPHLGKTRVLARLLAFDIRLAVDEADADRVASDVHALLGMARQLSAEPILISSLVGVAIHELAMQRLAMVIDESPDLLSRDHIVALSHRIAADRDSTLTLRLEAERMMFEDLLQRSFTDDGRGGGRLTPEGARLMTQITSPPPDFAPAPDEEPWVIRSAGTLAMPVLGATVRGRIEQSRMHAELMDTAEHALAAGPASIHTILEPADQRLESLASDPVSWYPLAQLFPAISRAIVNVFAARASADETLALLAAAAFRQDQARWPQTLDELVPTYLPRVPDDPFVPGSHLHYRLENSTPRLWYAGADADDDDGQAPPAPRRPAYTRQVNDISAAYQNAANVPDGDWVLFPPQD